MTFLAQTHPIEGALVATARKELVDVALTRWYHTISKCVRGGWLLKVDQDGGLDRKKWIENRLKLLTANFSVAVGGFSIVDNHLHVLCRLDPELTLSLSDEDVVRRWIAVYPPRGLKVDDQKILKTWVRKIKGVKYPLGEMSGSKTAELSTVCCHANVELAISW